MDFFESVPIGYLRADRTLFVNSEYCLQCDPGDNPDNQKGRHWYVDAMVVDFKKCHVFLCEFSYAKGLGSMLNRLKGWQKNWGAIPSAIARDSSIPSDWMVRPWLFAPESMIPELVEKVKRLTYNYSSGLPVPRITPLEMTLPWHYKSWNRNGEAAKPDCVPIEMRE